MKNIWQILLTIIVVFLIGAFFYMGYVMGQNHVTQDYLENLCQAIQWRNISYGLS